jgi:hypothetical protein
MRELRERLVLVHGTNFFVTPDELAGKVLAAVSSHAAKMVLPQVVRHMQRTQLGFVANVVELGISARGDRAGAQRRGTRPGLHLHDMVVHAPLARRPSGSGSHGSGGIRVS